MTSTGHMGGLDADVAHLIEADATNVWHPFTRHKSYDASRMILGGEGCWVTDAGGRRVLDAFAGLWSINLGYGRRDLADAITAQLHVLPASSMFGQGHPLAARLAERLAALAPGDLDAASSSRCRARRRSTRR